MTSGGRNENAGAALGPGYLPGLSYNCFIGFNQPSRSENQQPASRTVGSPHGHMGTGLPRALRAPVLSDDVPRGVLKERSLW